MNTITQIIIQAPVILFSVIIHEYAHGWMAEKRGDDTARIMGRLTLNPLPHIDLFGTIILPAICIISHLPVFGWAKPVPVNPYRLNDPKRDMVWVSLAGPFSNFAIAVAAAFVMWVVRTFPVLPQDITVTVYELMHFTLIINVILPVFNLFPVPPLDGSKVVMGILPPALSYRYASLEPYGFIIIIFLMMTNVFWLFLGPVVSLIVMALGGGTNYL
jgi:Zn-dependent protease